jgi:hypothetical protein
MLAYLDALIAALAERDIAEAERLLAHPLARLLPDDVRDEARAISALDRAAPAAPLRAMQLRRQTAELLRDAPAAADSPESPEPVRSAPTPHDRRAHRPQQMELSLSA